MGKDHLRAAWVQTSPIPFILRLLNNSLSLILFINLHFQFKLSMPKLSWPELIILPTLFSQSVFLLCSHSWAKSLNSFSSYIYWVEWLAVPLLAFCLASLIPTMSLQTYSALAESTCGFLNMPFTLTSSCSKFSFPSFPPGSSFKTCWFMTALRDRYYHLPFFLVEEIEA